MNIIISHDLDHITALEHYRDLFIPKFLVKSFIELLHRKITLRTLGWRLFSLMANKLNNTMECLNFDRDHDIPSTYFVAVTRGQSLSYNTNHAKTMIAAILKQGCHLGIHGISCTSSDNVLNEHRSFKSLTGIEPEGIRMHYLNTRSDMLDYFSEAGYRYDTSTEDFSSPFRHQDIWEFPIHLMDTRLFNVDRPYQTMNSERALESSLQLIKKAEEMDLSYFNIDTHDVYFSPSFPDWKSWYMNLILQLKSDGYTFLNYIDAIEELSRHE